MLFVREPKAKQSDNYYLLRSGATSFGDEENPLCYGSSNADVFVVTIAVESFSDGEYEEPDTPFAT